MNIERVTRQSPCVICGKPDWCGVASDGRFAVCMRESRGAVGTTQNGGYLHRLVESQPRSYVRTRTATVSSPTALRSDLIERHDCYQRAVDFSSLQSLADVLGLSAASLYRLRIGWDRESSAWTFPMKNANGAIVGFRLRLAGGKKLSLRGGHEGIFIPEGVTWESRQLLLAEGPTDTAALLDLGFDAIGRPSCLGGVSYCEQLVRRHWPLDVVIVSDADDPGIRGAERLAERLTPYAQTVRVIRPPDGMKDARAWGQAGATAQAVRQRIGDAEIKTLSVQGVVR